MRLEEMTTDDLREFSPFCDTVLLTCGGLAFRPPHLPTGTGWYILRRLRDSLEEAFGGRILSLPVLGLDAAEDEGSMAAVSTEALQGLFDGVLSGLGRHLAFRSAIFLTDSLAKESAFLQSFTRYAVKGERLAPFVWWRDGLPESGMPEAGLDAAAPRGYSPSGAVETSILLAIAKRLVDLEQKSAVRHGAVLATAAQGKATLEQVEATLRRRAEALWSS